MLKLLIFDTVSKSSLFANKLTFISSRLTSILYFSPHERNIYRNVFIDIHGSQWNDPLVGKAPAHLPV